MLSKPTNPTVKTTGSAKEIAATAITKANNRNVTKSKAMVVEMAIKARRRRIIVRIINTDDKCAVHDLGIASIPESFFSCRFRQQEKNDSPVAAVSANLCPSG